MVTRYSRFCDVFRLAFRDHRANLSVCWRMAEQASSEPERLAWLDVVECWRLLVITDDGSSTGENFDTPPRRPAFRDRVIDGVRRQFSNRGNYGYGAPRSLLRDPWVRSDKKS
jgi:hypothetical protein